MKKSKRLREKRVRPEKIISEHEFLTGERFTKEDLPREMVVYVKEKSNPKVNGLTKKYLGHGKRPKWMDCPEELLEQILAELKEIHGILSDWYRHYLGRSE